jgi:hypothetical protein
MPNNQNTTRRVKDSIDFYLNNPKNQPLPTDQEYMSKNLPSSKEIKNIYDKFRDPRIKKGGKKNKRKSNKRKSNKRKSNKRKYTIRRRRK